MLNVKPRNFINVTQYLQNGTYYWGGASPCLQFIPNPGSLIYSCFKRKTKIILQVMKKKFMFL